jgi:hypothetical protein
MNVFLSAHRSVDVQTPDFLIKYYKTTEKARILASFVSLQHYISYAGLAEKFFERE